MKLSMIKKGVYFLLLILISMGVVSYIHHLKAQEWSQELKLEQVKNEITKDNVVDLDAVYQGGSQIQVRGELKEPDRRDFVTFADISDMGDLEDMAKEKGINFQFSWTKPRPLFKTVTPIVFFLLATISVLYFWKKWREA